MGVCMLYAQQGPILGLILAAAVLKFLTLFEQRALYFHFALGPANNVGCCCPVGISNENKTIGNSNVEYNSKTYCFYYHYPKITCKFP